MPNLDSVKTLIKLPARLVTQAVEALKDGWTWSDAVGFFDEALLIPGFMKALPAAGARIKEGLSDADIDELELYAESELDIPSVEVKDFVGDLVAWAALTYNLFEKAKKLKAPPATP